MNQKAVARKGNAVVGLTKIGDSNCCDQAVGFDRMKVVFANGSDSTNLQI